MRLVGSIIFTFFKNSTEILQVFQRTLAKIKTFDMLYSYVLSQIFVIFQLFVLFYFNRYKNSSLSLWIFSLRNFQ
jgi:predicted membrane-bound mannosyltransferase